MSSFFSKVSSTVILHKKNSSKLTFEKVCLGEWREVCQKCEGGYGTDGLQRAKCAETDGKACQGKRLPISTVLWESERETERGRERERQRGGENEGERAREELPICTVVSERGRARE